MNDRLKFRFWDEDFGYKYCELGDDIPTSKSLIDEYEQCTGVNDKNGKLIFEGDILKNHRGEVVEVVWNNLIAAFYLVGLKEEWDNTINEDIENYVIIGNVHKNPELLKEEK